MQTLILILSSLWSLYAPPQRLTIRLHLGDTRDAQIVRSELGRPHWYFLSRQLQIRRHYQIMVSETLYKGRPAWQIGRVNGRGQFRGGEITEFLPGTFSASGSFMKALKSVAVQDQWDRGENHLHWWYGHPEYYQYSGAKIRPVPFPAPPQHAIPIAPVPMTEPLPVAPVEEVP